MENFDVNRFLAVFAEILSDEFGVQITTTATPKNAMEREAAAQ